MFIVIAYGKALSRAFALAYVKLNWQAYVKLEAYVKPVSEARWNQQQNWISLSLEGSGRFKNPVETC